MFRITIMSGPSASLPASGPVYPMWSATKGYQQSEIVRDAAYRTASGVDVIQTYKKRSTSTPPIEGDSWKKITLASGAVTPAAWSASMGYASGAKVTSNGFTWQKKTNPTAPHSNTGHILWDNYTGGRRTKKSKKSRKGKKSKKASRRR